MIDTQQVLCAAGGLSINWKKYQFLKRRDSGAPNTCESKEIGKFSGFMWIFAILARPLTELQQNLFLKIFF